MSIQVTILGSNSAIPTLSRNPTSQIIHVDQEIYLIDCGEGTQVQLRKFGIKFQRISRIFISHLHGDHYFGLIGLLNTMHLLTRNKALHIHAPKELEDIINLQLNVSHSKLCYEIEFHELTKDNIGVVYSNQKVEISSTRVNHRIECFGFIFKEQPHPLKISKDAIDTHGLSIQEIVQVKAGKDIIRENGKTLLSKDLTLKPSPQLKYSFITDTKPSERYYQAISNSDLLYHETTFLENQSKRAKETFHTTAKQAAKIAKKTNCKKLIIGHFSNRYNDLNPLVEEAKTEFANVELAIEGNVFKV
ncbi:MAG: ribonuclease Z [Salibacteraceae bacterium]